MNYQRLNQLQRFAFKAACMDAYSSFISKNRALEELEIVADNIINELTNLYLQKYSLESLAAKLRTELESN